MRINLAELRKLAEELKAEAVRKVTQHLSELEHLVKQNPRLAEKILRREGEHLVKLIESLAKHAEGTSLGKELMKMHLMNKIIKLVEAMREMSVAPEVVEKIEKRVEHMLKHLHHMMVRV